MITFTVDTAITPECSLSPDSFFEYSSHSFAARFCRECPIRIQCYLNALMSGDSGTWGGIWMSPTKNPGQRKFRDFADDDAARYFLILCRRYLCERHGLEEPVFVSRYGHGERGLYTAVMDLRGSSR